MEPTGGGNRDSTRCYDNVVLLLCQRRRRWPTIKTTFVQHVNDLLFSEDRTRDLTQF